MVKSKSKSLSELFPDWLPEWRLAMEAIGNAVRGRTPTPELLSSLTLEYRGAIAEHEVKIAHRPKGTLSPSTAFYEIEIVGKRLNGRWNRTTGQLRDVLNLVCPEFPIRLS